MLGSVEGGFQLRIGGNGVITNGAESNFDFDDTGPLELLEQIPGTTQSAPLVGNSLLESAIGLSGTDGTEAELALIEPAVVETAEVGPVVSWPAKIWIPALLGLSLTRAWRAWAAPMPTWKAHSGSGFEQAPACAAKKNCFEIEHEAAFATSTWRGFYGDSRVTGV